MIRKYITILGFILLPFAFPAAGDAAPFTLYTVMNGVRIDGRGTMDFSSSERFHVSFSYPRDIGLGLKEDASRVLRECLDGKRTEIYDGITCGNMRKHPHTMKVDFPQNTYMVLVLGPEEDIRDLSDGSVYDASFREKDRELPFLLHVTGNQISMFTTSLLPIGWITMREGMPGEAVRVMPDTAADIHLKRLAEIFASQGAGAAAKVPGRHEGAGWVFECVPFTKKPGDPAP